MKNMIIYVNYCSQFIFVILIKMIKNINKYRLNLTQISEKLKSKIKVNSSKQNCDCTYSSEILA